MKTILKTLSVALFATSLTFAGAARACPDKDGEAKEEEAPHVKDKAPVKGMVQASFHVDGMHCEGCGEHVRTALLNTDGVIKVEVKLADKRVVVSYDKTKVTPAKIAKIITDAGYKAATEA